MGVVRPRLGIERLGSHVDAVRPCDRSGLGIDRHAREVGRVPQLLEHAAPLALREVDVADHSVLEREAEPVLADRLDASDVHERRLGWDADRR